MPQKGARHFRKLDDKLGSSNVGLEWLVASSAVHYMRRTGPSPCTVIPRDAEVPGLIQMRRFGEQVCLLLMRGYSGITKGCNVLKRGVVC